MIVKIHLDLTVEEMKKILDAFRLRAAKPDDHDLWKVDFEIGNQLYDKLQDLEWGT